MVWKYNRLVLMCVLCVAAAEIAAELEQDDRSEKGGEVGATVKHRERTYMGMLEYRREDEAALTKNLILGTLTLLSALSVRGRGGGDSFWVYTLVSAVYGGGGLIPGTHPSFSCVWWGWSHSGYTPFFQLCVVGGGLILGTLPSFSCVWWGWSHSGYTLFFQLCMGGGGLIPGTRPSFSCVC